MAKIVREVIVKLGATEQVGGLTVGPHTITRIDRSTGEVTFRVESPEHPLWTDPRAVDVEV